MTPANPLPRLLVALGVAGVELAPHPDDPARLRHRPATLPPDLLALLRPNVADVRALLTEYAPDPDSDAAAVLAERLGIADDLNMPTHPGAPAWLIAVGESVAIADAEGVEP